MKKTIIYPTGWLTGWLKNSAFWKQIDTATDIPALWILKDYYDR